MVNKITPRRVEYIPRFIFSLSAFSPQDFRNAIVSILLQKRFSLSRDGSVRSFRTASSSSFRDETVRVSVAFLQLQACHRYLM